MKKSLGDLFPLPLPIRNYAAALNLIVALLQCLRMANVHVINTQVNNSLVDLKLFVILTVSIYSSMMLTKYFDDSSDERKNVC